MKRFSSCKSGHDCIRNPCGKYGCGTSPGSNHGIADDIWHYAVSDGSVALSLQISSGVFPSSVPASTLRSMPDKCNRPRSFILHVHATFPVNRGQLVTDAREKCEYLGHCFGDEGSCLRAQELFDKLDVASTFEQSELFWIGLEKAWVEEAKPMYDQRIDNEYERCAHCDGIGMTRKGDS